MTELVSGFTCRNGSEGCYFCGKLKGEYHDPNCRWITDMKVRNLVGETNLAYKELEEAKRDIQRFHEDREYLWKNYDKLLENHVRKDARIRNMKRHMELLEAFLETIVKRR
jgi:hypothetical protein